MNSNHSVRTYGSPPFSTAVIHGGPGAPGYMAPVARELSKFFGVIEPLQTQDTLNGQIEELHYQLKSYGDKPFTLVGSSWGAVLALLVNAKYPDISNKLILIGSATFDIDSSKKVKEIRTERTSKEKLFEIEKLEKEMNATSVPERNRIFQQIVDLEFDADAYDPITRDIEVMEVQIERNQSVWRDFKKLRDSEGILSKEFSKIRSETILIHGDYDPHGIEGIHPFLKSCIPHIRLEWLEQCGHYPWIEKHAKDKFFDILIKECQ